LINATELKQCRERQLVEHDPAAPIPALGWGMIRTTLCVIEIALLSALIVATRSVSGAWAGSQPSTLTGGRSGWLTPIRATFQTTDQLTKLLREIPNLELFCKLRPGNSKDENAAK
jgi:hypothetical protein